MGQWSFITKQRAQYAWDLRESEKYWPLSALLLGYFNVFKDVARVFVRGKTLDAGAGMLNAKPILMKYCDQYVGLDRVSDSNKIDMVGDIQAMDMIKSSVFDTVYASQVLEHVPRPWDALSEIYRILKPNGYVIISVPHLSALHQEPLDFYRYTPYGLRFLMERAGFSIEAEYRTGGLISFLCHPLSLILVCSCWPTTGIRWVVWFINKYFIVLPALWIDQHLGFHGKYPANILLVGKKG